jgi:YggT family protein
MLDTIDNAFIFLIETLFNLYILILMLRMILQWVGAHFYNPVSQFIVKLTNPVVKPLRQILPPLKGVDLASMIILVALEFIKLFLVIWLKTQMLPDPIGLIIMAFGDILGVVLSVFFFAIIISVILSWVSPRQYNPLTEILHLITEPLLRPARKIIPPIAGFDISPIPVLIILQFLTMLIANPLMNTGLRLAVT